MRANERDQNAAIASSEMSVMLYRVAEDHDLTDWEFIRAVSLAASKVVSHVAKVKVREERADG